MDTFLFSNQLSVIFDSLCYPCLHAYIRWRGSRRGKHGRVSIALSSWRITVARWSYSIIYNIHNIYLYPHFRLRGLPVERVFGVFTISSGVVRDEWFCTAVIIIMTRNILGFWTFLMFSQSDTIDLVLVSVPSYFCSALVVLILLVHGERSLDPSPTLLQSL